MEIMIDNREDNRRIASAVKYYTHAEYDKNAHEYHGNLNHVFIKKLSMSSGLFHLVISFDSECRP